MKVQVLYEERLIEQGECTYECDAGWHEYADDIYASRVTGVAEVKTDGEYVFEVPDDLDHVFVLWYAWGDGDTFRGDRGRFYAVNAFSSEEEAEKARQEIKKLGDSLGYQFPGTGYFGSIEDIRVERWRIEK